MWVFKPDQTPKVPFGNADIWRSITCTISLDPKVQFKDNCMKLNMMRASNFQSSSNCEPCLMTLTLSLVCLKPAIKLRG